MGLRLADFLIIGAQRCGTTSMQRYLDVHPQIAVAPGEPHFFTANYAKGLEWYASRLKRDGNYALLGDKSPNYIVDPIAPSLVKETLPNAKLIMLVRNPVDRIWSHYHHMVRVRLERRRFKVALHSFPGREDGWYPYLKRGYYYQQLTHWFKLFPREQFHVVHSERFFSDTAAVYNEVLDFLGLPHHRLATRKRYGGHLRPGMVMPPDLKALLIRHYRSHNEALYDLLERDLGWDK